MKRRSRSLFTFICLVFGCLGGVICLISTHGYGQVNPRCLTPQYDSLLKSKYPSLRSKRTKLNELIVESQRKVNKSAHLRTAQSETTIVIPVVVHVVHNTRSGAIGGANNTNISDEQILSQIEVLNEDYRRKQGTKGFNTNPAGADVNIEFRLATLDPNGNSSRGITRTYSEQSSFDIDLDDVKLKALSYWPTNRYLNIWVTSLKNKYLGYAQFPDVDNVPGLPAIGGLEKTDGVVINHTNFGRRTGTVVSGVYGEGRTTTHEVAHWLGLLHTWGDEDCGDDYCEDTPAAEGPNNTVNCPDMFSSCTGIETKNMIENFLDYSPDLCMNVFTQDQKERIRRVLELSPRRAEMVRRSSEAFQSGFGTVDIRPNPASDEASIILYSTNFSSLTLEVINSVGKVIQNVSYQLSGTELTLDVRTLPSGLYFIRISTDKEIKTTKLLVTKKS